MAIVSYLDRNRYYDLEAFIEKLETYTGRRVNNARLDEYGNLCFSFEGNITGILKRGCCYSIDNVYFENAYGRYINVAQHAMLSISQSTDMPTNLSRTEIKTDKDLEKPDKAEVHKQNIQKVYNEYLRKHK